MILAIDTGTRQVGLALATATDVLAEHSWRTSDNHTRELAPAVERVLRQSGVPPGELRAIAVAIGPGSFTGLRIGLGLAKGMALARDIPLVGVPTLDIVATAQPVLDGKLLAVLQAGRGRIAICEYRLEGRKWQAVSEGSLTTWEGVLELLAGENIYVCGEVDAAGRKVLRGRARVAQPALNVRRPACLAQIAHSRLKSGDVDDAATLAPRYLHLPTVTAPGTERVTELQ